jgi:STE24 endopeptidase
VPQTRALKDDRLAADARRFAKQQGVPDIPVRVEDVDEFTDEPNAFAIGLGPTRRVFLWNTLLRKPFSKREIRVVIAHELGHHSRDHLWKLTAWFGLIAVPGAWGIALVTRRRGGMFQARAVPLALLAAVVLQIALAPAQNVVSRRYEAEADWVALGTTRDPGAAVELHEELAEKSLTDPDPPGWAFVLFDTHPTPMQRIEMARAWRERNLRHPR